MYQCYLFFCWSALRALLAVETRRINNIQKWANSASNSAKEVEFVLADGGTVGEDNSGGLVQISKIFEFKFKFKNICDAG